MLQQTQTQRVIPKYISFLKKFPTLQALAQAPLKEVLIVWQGLGYNRRAKMLHKAAQSIVFEKGGVLPTVYEDLVNLPGIGEYTAKAIRVFVWDKPEVLIETNVRAVFIHEFFNTKKKVSDKDIRVLVQRTLPRKNFSEWYAGLMDYGSYLKQTYTNPSRKSATHAKQTAFVGSDREIRGAIIRVLSKKPLTKRSLTALPFDKDRIEIQLEKLLKEGLIEKARSTYRLPS